MLTGSKKNFRQINKLNIDGSDEEDKTTIAKHFNTYFSTIAEKIRSQLSTVPCALSKLKKFVESQKSPDVKFLCPVITSSQVIQNLTKVSPDKSSVIDKIGGRVLRVAAPVVAPRITRLINLSLSTGSFPSRWKTAMVTPLFKSGNEHDPCTCRPISVLPILSKII